MRTISLVSDFCVSDGFCMAARLGWSLMSFPFFRMNWVHAATAALASSRAASAALATSFVFLMSSTESSRGAVLSLTLMTPASHASTRSFSSVTSSFARASRSAFAFSSSSCFFATAARCSLICCILWSTICMASWTSCCTFWSWLPSLDASSLNPWLNSAFSLSTFSGVAAFSVLIALRMFMADSCSKRLEAWSIAFCISVWTSCAWLPQRARFCPATCWSFAWHCATVSFVADLSSPMARRMFMAASRSCAALASCCLFCSACCLCCSICCLFCSSCCRCCSCLCCACWS
mmetsp:Transcript_11128/g.32859  ORF Transcript_11128/g.32859 Transcript_11128/m.32859 type:complete len:292 (-) Transcript_11128:83-958(-)